MRAIRILPSLAILLFLSLSSLAQTPLRPRITGISNITYFVSDLPKAVAFWHDFLGFDVSYDGKASISSDGREALLKINDHQSIELLNRQPAEPKNFMSHITFRTDNVEHMRTYLASKGIEVPPHASKSPTGNLAIKIKDPDGTVVEFFQPQRSSIHARIASKSLPETRISQQMYHVGFLVGNSERALTFYGKILGFHETWRGTRDPTQLAWITMQVPDGTDYVELMLYRALPETYGVSNHVALAVPDINAAEAALQARPAFPSYGKPIALHTGVNGKRQFNLFDPDGTRVELMEPFTADGKPVPSSTAPPPPPSHP